MPVYSAYTWDFSAGSHSFRCVYSIFTCSGAFFFAFFAPDHCALCRLLLSVLQGKVSLVYSLPSEKYWSRRQDEFSQLFQEGYVLLQCKAVKGKCQSKYRNVEKQSNPQTQRQKHNICPLGIRITQTNRLPSDCLKTQRQTHKVYPLKVRAKGSEHSYLAHQANEWR